MCNTQPPYELLHIWRGARFVTTVAAASGYTRSEIQDGIHLEIFVARKKKVKRFRAVTAVKELARERVGTPPAGQIVIEKKKKPEKYKPTLKKLLEE